MGLGSRYAGGVRRGDWAEPQWERGIQSRRAPGCAHPKCQAQACVLRPGAHGGVPTGASGQFHVLKSHPSYNVATPSIYDIPRCLQSLTEVPWLRAKWPCLGHNLSPEFFPGVRCIPSGAVGWCPAAGPWGRAGVCTRERTDTGWAFLLLPSGDTRGVVRSLAQGFTLGLCPQETPGLG